MSVSAAETEPVILPRHSFLAKETWAARLAADIRDHRGDEFLQGRMLDTLTLGRAGQVRIVYAPFDHVTPTARLVLVGITPGRTQAENALAAYRSELRSGADIPQALKVAKSVGAFSGTLRGNLVAMLDHVGAHRALGVNTTADLFDPHAGLIHTTSALRYPVLRGDANYNGTPDPLGHALLLRMIDTHLAAEATALPDALWLPLGRPAERALDHVAHQGLLHPDKILHGLPHPSGANAERIAYFLGRKPRVALSVKTKPDLIDVAKDTLSRQMTSLAI